MTADGITLATDTPQANIAAVGDLVATNNGWGANSEANFDKIWAAIDAIITALINAGIIKSA